MQCLFTLTQLTLLVAMVTGTENQDWSVQWYTGEPYQLSCGVGNDTDHINIVWDTPKGKGLHWPLDDSDFQIMNIDGTHLLIKSISPELHGVYVCNVYNKTTGMIRKRYIHGVNLHEELYRDQMDKYKPNLKVAGIATGSFLGLVILLSIIWNFRYQEEDNSKTFPNEKSAHQEMKETNESEVYENSGFDTFTQL